MNSELMYRESILPLLLADAKVKITKGMKMKLFHWMLFSIKK